MAYTTKDKILAWFLLDQNSTNVEVEQQTFLDKDVNARIKSLHGNAFTLYGANEYDVAYNLFQNLKGELNDLINTFEKYVPVMSKLYRDHESCQEYLAQLKDTEENMLKYSVEHIDTLLNEINNLFVTPFLLLHKHNLISPVEIISYSHSGLTRITPEMMGIFKQYSNDLKAIDLKNNNLRYFPEGFFNDFPSLFMISLQKNKLTRLPENTFSGSSNVEFLHLKGNNFDYIHPSNQAVLKKTHNSKLYVLNAKELKRTPLYSLTKDHAAKVLSVVTFALAMSIASYLTLSSMLVSSLVSLGLSLITYKQSNKWIHEFDQKRNTKGLQPTRINDDAMNMGKLAAESITSEALSWISPTAHKYYDSYCFGLREQQYASFKDEETKFQNEERKNASPKMSKI